MRKYRHIILSIAASWQLLMDLPRQPGGRAVSRPGARVKGRRVLVWFPVLATVNGLILALSCDLVEALSSRWVGAAAFALLTLLYLAVRHSGRGWVMFVSWVLNLRDGYGFFDALSAARSDRSELDREWGGTVMAMLALLMLLILFLVGLFGSPYFMAAVLVCSSVVQGQQLLILPPEEGGVSDQRWIGRLIMWLVAAAIATVWFFIFPVATVMSSVVVLLAMCWIGGNSHRAMAGFGADMAAWTESAAELLMLVFGMLLTI